MSRTGSAGGKKRILIARAPRRRKRDDMPLVRLSSFGWFFFLLHGFSIDKFRERACFITSHENSSLFNLIYCVLFNLDESKSLFPYETRPAGTEKVRFDTEALEQMKEREGGTGGTGGTSEGRSASGSRTTNTYRIRRQASSDSSLNASPRKKTEKIRIKEALDILETYRARYRIRSGGKILLSTLMKIKTKNIFLIYLAEISDIPIKWRRDLTLKRVSATTDDPTTPVLSGKIHFIFCFFLD
jgi:hypothetical protein